MCPVLVVIRAAGVSSRHRRRDRDLCRYDGDAEEAARNAGHGPGAALHVDLIFSASERGLAAQVGIAKIFRAETVRGGVVWERDGRGGNDIAIATAR